jgi:protein-L-isoaspartate(D-aspartate) O-methyltransferase
LPIGYGQTISQPYIVALMTELLEAQAGDKVLEIGTGSGYQAAVLNELTPRVYTIEIVKPLYERAVKRLDKLGYKTIQTRLADGYDGWKEHAPFDGIIVTCAAGHVPPPLWEQLKEGGRMVIPVGGVYETQRLLVLTKQEGGKRQSRNVLPVRFVPMTGKIEKP